ncbi:hypothetical protein C8Q79DRAFT_717084 [Trametes meyenii]|nr:hypothetical protein C8Q79DRAFT_717084 [Trametes meyenii]
MVCLFFPAHSGRTAHSSLGVVSAVYTHLVLFLPVLFAYDPCTLHSGSCSPSLSTFCPLSHSVGHLLVLGVRPSYVTQVSPFLVPSRRWLRHRQFRSHLSWPYKKERFGERLITSHVKVARSDDGVILCATRTRADAGGHDGQRYCPYKTPMSVGT